MLGVVAGFRWFCTHNNMLRLRRVVQSCSFVRRSVMKLLLQMMPAWVIYPNRRRVTRTVQATMRRIPIPVRPSLLACPKRHVMPSYRHHLAATLLRVQIDRRPMEDFYVSRIMPASPNILLSRYVSSTFIVLRNKWSYYLIFCIL